MEETHQTRVGEQDLDWVQAVVSKRVRMCGYRFRIRRLGDGGGIVLVGMAVYVS